MGLGVVDNHWGYLLRLFVVGIAHHAAPLVKAELLVKWKIHCMMREWLEAQTKKELLRR